jgi:hypothetical protein
VMRCLQGDARAPTCSRTDDVCGDILLGQLLFIRESKHKTNKSTHTAQKGEEEAIEHKEHK